MIDDWLYLVTDTERWQARAPDAYAPPDLDAEAANACLLPEQIATAAQPIHDIGLKPVLLTIDRAVAGRALETLPDGRTRVVGPIPIAAIVRAAPLRPDGRGGFTVRDPTPVDHTLYGVLTRLQLDDDDPALRWKLDRAYARDLEWVRRYCRAQLWGFSAAAGDEIVQDVLLESWRQLRAYSPDAKFKSWLAAIALNKCRAARRKRQDQLLGDDDLLGELLTEGGEVVSILERLEARERDALVAEAAAEALDPLDQEIALLRYQDDLPFEEIARLKKLDGVGAVRAAMMRIRRRLGPVLRNKLTERGLR